MNMRYIGLSIVAALAMAGCSREHTEFPTDGEAIGFSPSVVRAAVSSLGDGDSFAVWARESREGVAQTIFSQEEVRCVNSLWSYDNIRYWQMGAVYDFYALYPHDVPNAEFRETEDGKPELAVSNFDARNSEDLMVAEQTGMLYEGNPSPVAFSFRHLLSKVEFVGRLDPALKEGGVQARLISARLYGMPATGSCTIASGVADAWTYGENTTVDAPFSSSGTIDLSVTGESLFGELLPFSQTVGDEWVLEIEYEYIDANYAQNRFTKSIRLADAGVPEWKAGMGYRYSFLVGLDYILFNEPEVVPWKSASGGIIIVE